MASSIQTTPKPEVKSGSKSGALIAAGIVLGAAQAGFFDGIVIHQLLQWHHMFTSIRTDATVAGLELNTLGDGLFHLFDWALNLVGLALLWRAVKRPDVALSTGVLLGSILLGVGLFNVTEGIIDHHLLGIHHVRSGPNESLYDFGFLAVSAAIALVGLTLLRSAKANKLAQ